jgi:hypothetical protein
MLVEAQLFGGNKLSLFGRRPLLGSAGMYFRPVDSREPRAAAQLSSAGARLLTHSISGTHAGMHGANKGLERRETVVQLARSEGFISALQLQTG